jgi:hypothetical protein
MSEPTFGPKVTVSKSCYSCAACKSECYAEQGDSGVDYTCAHPSLASPRYIGIFSTTPDWCPALAMAPAQPAQDSSGGVKGDGEVQAWQHEEDPARVISAVQKAQAERDGGASASSVKPYSVPLTRGVPVASSASDGDGDVTRGIER